MVRVSAWTVGLFGAGAAISRAFPVRWIEPVVLLALGLAFLLVSARMGRPAAQVAKLPARAPAAPAQAPAPATVPVEQSA